MSTQPSGWQAPRTSWQSADVPGAADFSRIESNTNAIETGARTLEPALAPTSNTGTLRQILSWIANRIKAIMGTTTWYSAPPVTLSAAKGHIDNKQNPHAVTAAQVGAATATALSSHTSNKQNPHAVTAAQVGAATATALSSHTSNKQNPHAVTAAQAGAAPASHTHGQGTYDWCWSYAYADLPLVRRKADGGTATWYTVGPAGSGADIEWDAMNNVPAGASRIRFILEMWLSHGSGANGNCNLAFMYAETSTFHSQRGPSITAYLQNQIVRETISLEVDVTENRTFVMRYYNPGDVTPEDYSIALYLEGWYA